MTPDSLQRAILDGLQFLLSQQSEEGFWSDWMLPPGESRIWTTAYAGYRLSSLRHRLGETTRGPLSTASSWLRAHEFPGGGWGYRESVGADADSTALAILFLSSQGMRPEDSCYRRLLGFQRADGGFATYNPPDGFRAWAMPHPEVTATAVAALLTRFELKEQCVMCGMERVQRNMAQDGLWNSYWWNSRLYSTEANLAALRNGGVRMSTDATLEALRSIQTRNCFEHALLILSLAHLGRLRDGFEDAPVSALVSAQKKDGSWPSAAILRQTDRDCEEPWKRENAGPLFVDQNRVFTTVTVLSALTEVQQNVNTHG